MDSAYSRSFPYLYRGVVESNIDPENMGRCKIRVPFIHGELTYPVDILPWARPIVLSPVGANRGSVNIPEIGDIVWVFFEGAVRDFPVYIGGTYGRGELHTDPNVVDFYIEDDTKISYNRVTKDYSISIGDSKIQVSSDGISIVGDTIIKGDMNISGTLTVSNLRILNSCNRECDCP